MLDVVFQLKVVSQQMLVRNLFYFLNLKFIFQTVGYDPIISEAEARESKITKMSLEEVFHQSDYLTVHTPLLPQTKRESILFYFF